MDEITKLKAQVYDINTEIQRLQVVAQEIVTKINELEVAKSQPKKS